LVEARVVDEGEEEVAAVLPSFDTVRAAIESISEQVSGVAKRINPKAAAIEFAVELALEAGKLTALLAQGSTKASMKIRLEF
jgi:hypothetical protein